MLSEYERRVVAELEGEFHEHVMSVRSRTQRARVGLLFVLTVADLVLAAALPVSELAATTMAAAAGPLAGLMVVESLVLLFRPGPRDPGPDADDPGAEP